MADIRDVIQKLRDTASELQAEFPVIILEQVTTAKSIIQDRIQETGKDHKGKQLGQYSDRKIPATFMFKDGKVRPTFIGKGRKSTDAKLEKLAREGKGVSYGDFRQLDGKQNKYVDLTFSGKMFRNTGLVDKGVQGKKVVAVLGQTDERSEKVANYNVARYGNFMQLSEPELERLAGDVAVRVDEIINKNLSGI